MSQVWTRAAWNQLIRDVNQVLQNPPRGISAIAPIAEVAAGHRWSTADIQAVQNALKQTCSTITFDATAALWKQSIIDQLNTAKGKAWCSGGSVPYIPGPMTDGGSPCNPCLANNPYRHDCAYWMTSTSTFSDGYADHWVVAGRGTYGDCSVAAGQWEIANPNTIDGDGHWIFNMATIVTCINGDLP